MVIGKGSRKVVIVGAGAVGATFAYALAIEGQADEIVLIDKNRDLAEGQVLDLGHGQPFFGPIRIRAGEAEDYADAQAIVITAGSAQKPGESRIDLLRRNAKIVESIVFCRGPCARADLRIDPARTAQRVDGVIPPRRRVWDRRRLPQRPLSALRRGR